MAETRYTIEREPCRGGREGCEMAIRISDADTDVCCTAHSSITSKYLIIREDGREHRFILEREQDGIIHRFAPPVGEELLHSEMVAKLPGKFDDMSPFSMGCTVTEEELREHNKIENGMIRL